MCTAASFRKGGLYFGRTLDNHMSYGEEAVIAPRAFDFGFKGRYAIVGMALVQGGYPLFYDAMNEAGLCMAGLNFVGNAQYFKSVGARDEVAQYEFIPFILSRCQSVEEAVEVIRKIRLTDRQFCENLPCAQLHWMISDAERDIVVECTKSGMQIFENAFGVLTNNPPFGEQLLNVSDYMHLSASQPENNFFKGVDMQRYSLGMGAIGLPGDLSSRSRFVRAAFVRNNCICGDGNTDGVNALFNILGSVRQVRGCNVIKDGCETTLYTSCCDASAGIYCYTLYENHAITGVDMRSRDLNSSELYRFPLEREERITLV